MLKLSTSAEKLVYKRAVEWLIRSYNAIKLMDPESIYTFQNNTNFIQGFVYRSLKSSAKETLDLNYDWNGMGAHKYITPIALELYNNNKKTAYIREHVVCKNIYFKEIIEELKKDYPDGHIIGNILLRYYFTALITKEENRTLDEMGLRRVMCVNEEWDCENLFNRYEKAGVELVENPYYVLK
ncbi:hypothetical protein [Mesobacillus zeae]|uniref:Uncharacterized protein n=1 Tax=Mesobacillus zeae TaxID=1917180 RepID=A0A398B6L0_9BACI|nr:hypothetical protein [Mesobacillus zeae]RID85191.1 hypothetical protein D1970_10495 [Mesobacillus zeae]